MSDAHKETARAHAALRAALPVMRRTLNDYFESVTVRRDPATIALAEWVEIAPDIRAVRLAEACVGPQPDQEGIDTDWVNAVLDRSREFIQTTAQK